jgi:hypothetical protein
MNSMWFTVEHYHNTHSAQYRCTHYTLLPTAKCFQSVCNSVTPWCVTLFSTNSSPVVHPPVHFPPAPHQSRHPPQGLSPEMRTVSAPIISPGVGNRSSFRSEKCSQSETQNARRASRFWMSFVTRYFDGHGKNLLFLYGDYFRVFLFLYWIIWNESKLRIRMWLV